MRHLLSIAALIVLTGCMEAARPPSLAPRPIETREVSQSVTPPTNATRAIDPALAARIATLMASLREGDGAFAKAATEGARALESGRGAATGSERWIVAQQSLSALQAARQRSADALAELDSLTVALVRTSVDDPSVGGLIELQAAQADGDAIVARQTARIDAATP